MEGSGQEDGSLESLLQEYEELFKHRYTEQDEDYMKTANMPNPAPPCVENWYTRPKRNFDYTRNQRGGHQDYRGRGGRGHHYGGRDNRYGGQGHSHHGHGHHGHRGGHGYQHNRNDRSDHQRHNRYNPY